MGYPFGRDTSTLAHPGDLYLRVALNPMKRTWWFPSRGPPRRQEAGVAEEGVPLWALHFDFSRSWWSVSQGCPKSHEENLVVFSQGSCKKTRSRCSKRGYPFGHDNSNLADPGGLCPRDAPNPMNRTWWFSAKGPMKGQEAGAANVLWSHHFDRGASTDSS